MSDYNSYQVGNIVSEVSMKSKLSNWFYSFIFLHSYIYFFCFLFFFLFIRFFFFSFFLQVM
jgi:hypothetical protein